jgi:transposase
MYHGSKLYLTIEQKNSLKSLMEKTMFKRQYRRLLAILQKSNGRTFKDISKEHIVNIRSVQRWVFVYLDNGTRGLKIKKTGSSQSRITDENKEIILSVLFNDPHLFGYIRNMWSLRSLAKCLTAEELDIPISFKHLHQRILKDMDIRCTRPKLELEHGLDYDDGGRRK